MSRCSILAFAVAILFAAPSYTDADVIKNISTGFDNSTGNLLSNGTLDTDYVVGPGGSGGRFGETPLVRTAPIPLTWLPDGASTASRWLVLPGTGIEGITVGTGTFFFDTLVDVSGFDLETVQITGLRYAADNKLVGVRINGTLVFSQDLSLAEEFGFFRDLGNRGLGLFQNGTNQIRFEVANDFLGVSPMGLRLEGAVEGRAVASIPEPSTLWLAGLASLVFSVWMIGNGKSRLYLHAALDQRLVGVEGAEPIRQIMA